MFLSVGMSLFIYQTALAANKKFAFRIKTKTGGIVGNILIEAKDVEAAKVKLMQRYPGCTILNVALK